MFALFGWQCVCAEVMYGPTVQWVGDPHEYPNIHAPPHPDEEISVSKSSETRFFITFFSIHNL